jgi:hypothetical protein
VELRPPIITHPTPVLAGETITVEFKLVNSSDKDILLLGARTGCGCTKVQIDGHSVGSRTRLELPPGESTLEMITDTQMQGGMSTFGFVLAYIDPITNAETRIDGRLNAVVCRGLVAMPSRIAVTKDKISEPIEIDLLDDFPGNYSLDKIEVSHPGLISVLAEDATDNEESHEEQGKPFIGHFKIRRRLVVHLNPAEELPTRQWIRLSSNYADLAPLEIPVKVSE